MKCFSTLSCVLIMGLFGATRPESDILESLPTSEREELLFKKIQNHILGVEKQISALDGLLDKYYKDYNYTEEDAYEYVSNPINTYMLIKRTALEWPTVKKVVFDKDMDKEFEEIEQLAASLYESKTDKVEGEEEEVGKTEL